MQNIQINCFHQLFQLRKSVSSIILKDVSATWLHTWLTSILGLMVRSPQIPESNLPSLTFPVSFAAAHSALLQLLVMSAFFVSNAHCLRSELNIVICVQWAGRA